MNTCILSIQRGDKMAQKKSPAKSAKGSSRSSARGGKTKSASTRKTTKTAGKSAKSTASRSAKKTKKSKRNGSGVRDEAVCLIVIALCIVALVSLFTKSMGVVGEAVSTYLKGLFGIGGYFLPFIVAVFCVWMIFSEERQGVGLKAGAGLLFIVCIAAFAQDAAAREEGGYYREVGLGLCLGTYEGRQAGFFYGLTYVGEE